MSYRYCLYATLFESHGDHPKLKTDETVSHFRHLLFASHFTAPRNVPNFQFLRRVNWLGVAEQNTQRPTTRLENYCESNQTYFSYSFDNVFHLPEFQVHRFTDACFEKV